MQIARIDIMSGISEITREYREMLRFSREELAHRADVETDLIIGIEEEYVEDVDISTLCAISQSLKLPLHVFFSLAELRAARKAG